MSEPAENPGGDVPPWEELGRERVGDFEVFRVDRLRLRSPRTGQLFDRHILDLPDWVNVVPVTPEGRYVLVEQYRFGAGAATLEFPAGTLRPGEDPVAGGLRELREETGYVAERAEVVATIFPDPAIQANRLHVVAAWNCRRVAEPQQDEGEDVHVRVLELPELRRCLVDGRIAHALALTTWFLYEHRARGGPAPAP